MQKKLKTSREFQTLSIPSTVEQQIELEASLIREGCLEPIITWNDFIIDGHKRYRFCIEEGIEFSCEEKTFSSGEEVVSWLCRKKLPQYEKRTPVYRYLVGRLYEAEKAIVREIRKKPKKQRDDSPYDCGWVSFRVAEELQLHRGTVEEYGKYAAYLEQIAEKSKECFDAILRQDIKPVRHQIEEYASYSERKLWELCRTLPNNGILPDNSEKLRNRRKNEPSSAANHEVPLSVGIKEMPAYDPDMELKGLILTIPTWNMALTRVMGKTEQATEKAKHQLSASLKQLRKQIDEMLEEIDHE